MNTKIAKELKRKAQTFARSKGLGYWKFGYRQLKKLWNETPRNKKRTVFE